MACKVLPHWLELHMRSCVAHFPHNTAQGMLAAWEDSCGPLDQYGMKHSRTFANLCNAGVPIDTLARTAGGQCSPAVPAS